jgi:hypothetical protein
MADAKLRTDRYVSVEHLVKDSASLKKWGYVADVGLVYIPVNIQPASPDTVNLYGGAMGSMFTMFAGPTASGILDGDRLTVSGSGEKYIVNGRENFDYGPGQHIEFVLTKPQTT